MSWDLSGFLGDLFWNSLFMGGEECGIGKGREIGHYSRCKCLPVSVLLDLLEHEGSVAHWTGDGAFFPFLRVHLCLYVLLEADEAGIW